MSKILLVIGKRGFIANYLRRDAFFKKKCVYINFAQKIIFKKNFKINELILDKLLKKNQIKFALLLSWRGMNNPDSKENKINYYYYKNLIKYFKKKLLKKVIFIGSIKEYGNLRGNINEKSILKPNNFYGIMKKDIGTFGNKIMGKKFLHLRVSNVLGLYENKRKFFNKIFLKKKIVIGKKLFFFRNFIVIDDLLKILKILIFDNSFGIYNIGSNLTYRFDNVIKKYCNSINVKPLKSDFDDENFFFENYNKFNFQ